MGLYDAALYIHIPYCTRKCDYCDFYSVTDYSDSTDTLTRIGQQIASDKSSYGIDRFLSVYIGGGTPGSLSPELISYLLNGIGEVNGGCLPREVTLECNPENVTSESLKIWQESGVNRISMGIQTFQDEFLVRAGRNSSRRKILQALKALSHTKGMTVSLDLIQGLPGMTGEDQIKDLEEAVAFGPDHVSWYTLILERGTVLAEEWEERQNLKLSGEDHEQIWLEGCLFLEQSGYKRYEVSSFARSGRICGHNQAYWEMKPYLGCGPGAVSMIRNSQGKIQRHRVAKNASAYGAGKLLLDGVEIPGAEEFLKDYLLMGLRMSSGIELASFRKIFGTNPDALFPRSLERFRKQGLIRIGGDRLATTPEGLDMLNSILITLYEELEEKGFTGSVNWPVR